MRNADEIAVELVKRNGEPLASTREEMRAWLDHVLPDWKISLAPWERSAIVDALMT